LREDYNSYSLALDIRDLDSIEDNKSSLYITFALKTTSHPVHSKWFKKVDDAPDTRLKNSKQPVWTRTG
jgi:hypothetical protein